MNAGEQQAALERARQGDTQALGALLDSFRPYVRYLVRALGGERVQARLDESDLIQDAFLEAHRDFAQFRGGTVAELTAWLRQIVLRTAGHTLRGHLATGKRDVAREGPATGLADRAADPASSPSVVAMRHEQAARMAEALARLPDDMQTVLLGRHMDGLAYAVLAERLGRSEAAVRVLYTRALRRLREECQG
jgi:RNA polymerase sigma-70 factor (ECF subfamily)